MVVFMGNKYCFKAILSIQTPNSRFVEWGPGSPSPAASLYRQAIPRLKVP